MLLINEISFNTHPMMTSHGQVSLIDIDANTHCGLKFMLRKILVAHGALYKVNSIGKFEHINHIALSIKDYVCNQSFDFNDFKIVATARQQFIDAVEEKFRLLDGEEALGHYVDCWEENHPLYHTLKVHAPIMLFNLTKKRSPEYVDEYIAQSAIASHIKNPIRF